MKKAIKSIILICLFFICSNYLQADSKLIKIKVVTDTNVYENKELLLIDGTGYIKINDLANILNANIRWYQVAKKVVFSYKNRELILFVDKSYVILDGDRRTLNKETKLIDGELWMPLELVVTKSFAKFIDLSVQWDNSNRVLHFMGADNIFYVPIKVKEELIEEETDEVALTTSTEKPVRKGKIKTIILDPGHGGKDPGAIGPHGLKEKDVVLKISKRLAAELEKKLDVNVYLTREDDRFVSLAERTKFANEKKADLFISIHANASLRPESEGFEIFFLSEKATDISAQTVANLENSVLALEDEKKQSEVGKILWSMVVNEHINESSELCGFILDAVEKTADIENRGVKQAGFYVLRGAEMPAVLVELAFISNPKEEKILKSKKFHKRMVSALCQGIENYKKLVEKK